MDRAPFVGRQEELGKLRSAVAQAAGGVGSIILVEGATGTGKSRIFTELEREAPEDGSLGDPIFATGECFTDLQQGAYLPFATLLGQIKHSDGSGRRRLLGIGKIITDTAPGWMSLLPGAGPLVGMGVKTLGSAGLALWGSGGSETLDQQFVATIQRLVQGKHPLVLRIENAQWIDRASTGLLLRLAPLTETRGVVIVLTCRPGDTNRDGALGRIRSELAGNDRFQVISLGDLGQPDVATYLVRRFGTTFGDGFPAWLIHLCHGNPLFLTQYLKLLTERDVIRRVDERYLLDGNASFIDGRWRVTGRLDEIPVPKEISDLLLLRIQGLDRDEERMLGIGSVQGLSFDSLVLAKVSRTEETTVMEEMDRVKERHQMITESPEQDWELERAEAYSFEHELMHRAFYDRLGERLKLLHHDAVGKVLQGVASEYAIPPRKLLIEIAFHASKAHQGKTAAEFYLRAAQATQADGASAEASHLAYDAIAAISGLAPTDVDRDRLFGEAVLVVVLCAVYGSEDGPGIARMLDLAVEGEAAARRAELPSLVAEIVAISGHLLIRSGRVPEALIAMRRALTLARETGDVLTEFFAITQLGSQLAKENLALSLEVRYEALKVYDERVSLDEIPPGQREFIASQHSNLLVFIGLGEFDSGNYETGIEWITRGLNELRAHHRTEELPPALNYLAQIYTAIGRFEKAKQLLNESLHTEDGSDKDHRNAWLGYNLGLLAKTHLEAGEIGTAAQVIAEAAAISEAFVHTDLLTIVRNYQGEILMHPGNPAANLDAAEGVLLKNYEESTTAVLHRAQAQAATLLGRLYLLRGASDEAERFSEIAVGDIERLGDLPAVRTEEVYYNHYLVLDAFGRSDSALRYLSLARDVVDRKLARMQDPENRTAFTDKVQLTREIIATHHARVELAAG